MLNKALITGAVVVLAQGVLGSPAMSQDLGPGVTRIKDGIFVYTAKDQESNVNVILTREGPVMIDTGQNVGTSQAAMSLIKKLTAQPVRFIIHTEPHADHNAGDYLFSPPAVVITAAGGTDSIRKNKPPAADKAWRLVLPHVEYQNRMSLAVGERSFELLYLKNVHSEADTAIWMPKERIIWAAASVGVKRVPNIRSFLTIPDILASIKLMRALNPEVVIPGHGTPGTTKIFDDMERYYALLMERVGQLAASGRTLAQAKAELRLPEYDDWSGKERIDTNIDAAWRALNKN